MNGNINICSNEVELDIKYGLYDLGEERESARSSLKYIMSDMNDIKTSYFRLGFHLHEFKVNAYYKDFGYVTFEEFCEANLELDKGSLSRCINVFLMTNSHNEISYKAGVKQIGCYGQMSDKYKDYSYSQLVEMLPLDYEKRKHVNPDMTVKEIRELKSSIIDISKDRIIAFVDFFRSEIKPFTRDNVFKEFERRGRRWNSYSGGDVVYQFSPGKIRVHYSNSYSFVKILDYYEKCGGRFEEEKVATSQPDGVRLCVNDLVTKKGIVLQNHIRRCQAISKETVELYDSNGKLIGRYECDLLMSGEIDNVGRKYYRVSGSERKGENDE